MTPWLKTTAIEHSPIKNEWLTRCRCSFSDFPHLTNDLITSTGSPWNNCPIVMLVPWNTHVSIFLADMLWRATSASDLLSEVFNIFAEKLHYLPQQFAFIMHGTCEFDEIMPKSPCIVFVFSWGFEDQCIPSYLTF